MKVGDIVRRKFGGWNAAKTKGDHGIIVRIFDKKCWRAHELGNKVNWDSIEPEPHAEVLINQTVITVPVVDLVGD